MSAPRRPKVVVLGMMTKMPVAGVVWQTVHYLVGLERLGYEAWYVEAHARTPSMLMEREDDDGAGLAAGFLDRVLRRFDLGDRWAYQALHDDGRCYGLSETELSTLYREAALIINLHGGTQPLPEHSATGRLVYVETDPVQLQIELHDGVQQTVDFLEPHVAFFTFGENYGNDDCLLPVSDRFRFRPTRQPVVLDFWGDGGHPPGDLFTTIGNWQQHWRSVELAGERYSWSKHDQFVRFLDLPERTGSRFELALSSYEEQDRLLLERHGWSVRPGLDLSRELDPYRDYIRSSLGEFTVAKDQNVRLRTGWFSDRSATYLAAGRPVITQDTAFGNILPTGEGLFAFSDLDEAVAAVQSVQSDRRRHGAAAAGLACEFFCAETVVARLLDDVGLTRRTGRVRSVDDIGGGASAGPDQVAEAAAELAALRAVVESMAESISVREAELAALLGEVARAESDGTSRIGYIEARCRLRSAVERLVPVGSAVAVVAKGGDELLRFAGRPVQCIPQDGSGNPLSFSPSCGRAAIAQVELARWKGADHLILPGWAAWWLDAYPDLRRHLDSRYQRVLESDDGAIWSLRQGSPARPLSEAVDECEHILGRAPVILDWEAGGELDALFPQCVVFTAEGQVLPFLDDTVDVVAVPEADGALVREAERVATTAVVTRRAGDRASPAAVRWTGAGRRRADRVTSIVVWERPGAPVGQHHVAMLAESIPSYVTAEIVVARAGAGRGPSVPAPTGASSDQPAVPVTVCRSWSEVAGRVKGGTVVVLDSSTVVLPGWLPPLLRTLAAHPRAGAVSGMVLAGDGRLVQPAPATGTVGGAGSSPYDIGAPRYNHVRDLGDCLSTLLAMPRELFAMVAVTTSAAALGSAAAAAAGRADRAVLYQPEAVGVRLDDPREATHG